MLVGVIKLNRKEIVLATQALQASLEMDDVVWFRMWKFAHFTSNCNEISFIGRCEFCASLLCGLWSYYARFNYVNYTILAFFYKCLFKFSIGRCTCLIFFIDIIFLGLELAIV